MCPTNWLCVYVVECCRTLCINLFICFTNVVDIVVMLIYK